MSKDDHTDDEQRNGDSLSKLLQRLQLPHIRAHYHELAQTAAEQGWGHLDCLKRLIEGEVARREDKSLAQRVRRARFPMPKTLDQFQWSWPKKINRPQIQNLFRLNFIEQKANVIFLGGVEPATYCPTASIRCNCSLSIPSPPRRTAGRDSSTWLSRRASVCSGTTRRHANTFADVDGGGVRFPARYRRRAALFP
jgi:hypothetical protein